MDEIVRVSRIILSRILLFLGLLFVLLNLTLYLDIGILTLKLSAMAPNLSLSKIELFNQEIEAGVQTFRSYIYISLMAFVVCGLFLWASLRISIRKALASCGQLGKAQAAAKVPAEDKAERKNIERRLFLHLVSVLQREGRLMDFLSENLEEYQDEQIGAAVRSIHENCKKSLFGYLHAEAVVKEAEGEKITIPPGFDPATIRLTGNVAGDPPFEGIVRHRGWKVSEPEMPVLSGTQNPNIIAPAEVEIA